MRSRSDQAQTVNSWWIERLLDFEVTSCCCLFYFASICPFPLDQAAHFTMSWTRGPWEPLLTRPSSGPHPIPHPSPYGQSAQKAPTSQGGCLSHILASTGPPQPQPQPPQQSDLMCLFPPASISLPIVTPTFPQALPNHSQLRQENMISNTTDSAKILIKYLIKYSDQISNFSVYRRLCSWFSGCIKGGDGDDTKM